ncbi:hypothetical protein SK571_45755 [Lentzea sp. BCCO 10_0798]|uniref:Multiple sugar transport system substrate-binding protein n=1 Tax=Lentzea kristufekii TaxID=3095430 RepID=A0ABU4U7Z5_9PSEU|nr:hypothetical protein [Lentzea sp. BCCO 10_0798]MDX8056718.1 hypothetical protein [Lentzea sp. BCCO 10_0798]
MGQRRPFRAVPAIATSVTCLLASACSAPASSPAPEREVTVAVWGGEQDAKTYQQRADLASERVSGVNVKLVHVSNGDYGNKIQKMCEEGTRPTSSKSPSRCTAAAARTSCCR